MNVNHKFELFRMSYKNTAYVYMPFSAEAACGDFYTYSSLRDLAEKCEVLQEETTRCRTIGMLQSIHGKFYLCEICPEAMKEPVPLVQLSVIFLKSPLPSTVIPYPVQVFGSVQWRNRPVIYANVVQVLNTSMALRMDSTMKSVASMHLARNVDSAHQDESHDDTLAAWADMSFDCSF